MPDKISGREINVRRYDIDAVVRNSLALGYGWFTAADIKIGIDLY
jgi:hypothetical protein